MTGVLFSFLALVALACGLELAGLALRKRRGSPAPGWGGLLGRLALTALLTVGVTLGIAFVLQWLGFTDRQFYRPSDRNYRQHEELGLAPEAVTFESRDGTALFGWFLSAEGEPRGTVLHLHGSDRNVSSTVRHAHWLTAHGLNVFAFDYRGYGRSEGKPSGQGVRDDAVGAIRYVRSRSDVDPDRLVLWGQSMGGQLAIVAAVEAGTQGIRAVIAEATYASHRHHVKDKVASMGPLWLVQWAVWLVTSDRLAAEHVVAELSPTPLLLVHGTADRGVLPYHAERLYAAAQEPREIWRVEGAEHLRVFQDSTQRERLVSYLAARLANGPAYAATPP